MDGEMFVSSPERQARLAGTLYLSPRGQAFRSTFPFHLLQDTTGQSTHPRSDQCPPF